MKKIESNAYYTAVNSAVDNVQIGSSVIISNNEYMILDYAKSEYQLLFVLYPFKESKYKILTQIRKTIILIRYVLHL